MLDTLTSADFTPLVDQTFRIALAVPADTPGAVDSHIVRELKLIEVTELGRSASPTGVRQPFSLIFHDAGPGYLLQGVYPVDHATLGRFDLFIVPLSAGATGAHYQAIFN